jgi:hypothetical protein
MVMKSLLLREVAAAGPSAALRPFAIRQQLERLDGASIFRICIQPWLAQGTLLLQVHTRS